MIDEGNIKPDGIGHVETVFQNAVSGAQDQGA